ncbi:hypothetical protein [Aureispira anguillae]|uniref:Uncharacterized protein n=1 Tax=Aureispira anguillae TaxID=2864201 RepID=A0A915YAT1_9BACT|nr:hypothetical protein [Aureispira anguillae]BDS09586.1 hypothetical protein AsAng_0002900 [Aureispira anguillae]
MDTKEGYKDLIRKLEERELKFKVERNFAGLINVCEQMLEMDSSLFIKKKFIPLKAYCLARLGKKEKGAKTFHSGSEYWYYTDRNFEYRAWDIISLFVNADPIDFSYLEFNTLISWLKSIETSSLVQNIVFDFEDIVGEIDLPSVSDVDKVNIEFSEKLLKLTFSGMLRWPDEKIYYDKSKNKILIHYKDHFLDLHEKDQFEENKKLAKKVGHFAPQEIVDKEVHFLIPRLLMLDFSQVLKKNMPSIKLKVDEVSNYLHKRLLTNNPDVEIFDVCLTEDSFPRFYKKLFSLFEDEDLDYMEEDLFKAIIDTKHEIAKKWLIKVNSKANVDNLI